MYKVNYNARRDKWAISSAFIFDADRDLLAIAKFLVASLTMQLGWTACVLRVSNKPQSVINYKLITVTHC